MRGGGVAVYSGGSESTDPCEADLDGVLLQEVEAYCDVRVFKQERKTCHSRRVATTLSILGRRTGSSCQQRTVMSQTASVKSRSCGRSGRSPSMISDTATGSVNSLNGYLPVKTLSGVKWQTINYSASGTKRKEVRERTSMTTMAKE